MVRMQHLGSCRVASVRIKTLLYMFLFTGLILVDPLEGPYAGDFSSSTVFESLTPDEPPREPKAPRFNLSRANPMAADLEIAWKRMEENLQPYFGDVVDTVIVVGNTHTKRAAVVREMATKRGQRLEERLIRRDASYLRGLGFFSDIDISAEKASPGFCRVIVEIVERPGLFMKYPYPVVNYDLEDGVSYGIRWRIKNFRGWGEELRIHAMKLRDKEHGANISWQMPWLAGRRLQLNSSLFTYRRLEEPELDDFIKERTGATAYFGFPLTASLMRQMWLATTFSFEWRKSRLTLSDNGTATSEFYRQNLLALGLELIFDSRDNRITPWSGIFSRVRALRFTTVRGLDQTYIFYFTSHYFYLPVSSVGTFIVALEGDIREGDLPDFFEIGIGGPFDLRGYPDNDRKGRAKLVGTLQFRRPVYGPKVFNIPYIGKFDLALNAVAFIDKGALMDSIEDLRDSPYDTTGGIGVEVISPIQDVMRLELAGDGRGNLAFFLTSYTRF
jgi:outer membrane protein assembly factor BamA